MTGKKFPYTDAEQNLFIQAKLLVSDYWEDLCRYMYENGRGVLPDELLDMYRNASSWTQRGTISVPEGDVKFIKGRIY